MNDPPNPSFTIFVSHVPSLGSNPPLMNVDDTCTRNNEDHLLTIGDLPPKYVTKWTLHLQRCSQEIPHTCDQLAPSGEESLNHWFCFSNFFLCAWKNAFTQTMFELVPCVARSNFTLARMFSLSISLIGGASCDATLTILNVISVIEFGIHQSTALRMIQPVNPLRFPASHYWKYMPHLEEKMLCAAIKWTD